MGNRKPTLRCLEVLLFLNQDTVIPLKANDSLCAFRVVALNSNCHSVSLDSYRLSGIVI